jgi:predicted permease
MFSDLGYRLRAIFHRNAVEKELEEELQFHLEQQAAKYARKGANADEANRMARLALEGPEQVKEQCRDARGTVLWDTILQDLRYAARQLRSAPAFATVVIAVLALGIGANTAIFSLLDVVVLRSLPVRDPQQLLVPRWTAKNTPSPYDADDDESCFVSRARDAQGGCTFSYPLFKSIESKDDIFSSVAAFSGPVQVNAMTNGAVEIINGEVVSGNFFQTLGVHAILGRTFDEHDELSTASAMVVLSYGYWQSAFGGDPSVIGKTVRLNAVPFTVIGVAEPGFNHLSPGIIYELWMPIHSSGSLGISWLSQPLSAEYHFWLRIIGRTKPGVTEARAEAALSAIVRNQMVYQSKILKLDDHPAVEVAAAHIALAGVRDLLAQPLYVLMCAVGLILLIACANIAGLMTARAAARQREIAIRLAIGAGRGRVIRQLLTESIVIGALGGLVGVVIAWFATRSLTSFLPMRLAVNPDLRILLFTSAISLASGILFGMAPALRTSRVHPLFSFGTGSAGLQHAMSSSSRRRWFNNSLETAQVALAVMLLMGAGLFVRTLLNLKTINPGFNPRNLLLFGLDPVALHYKESRIQNLYQALHERLASLPGVTGVTYSSHALICNCISSTDYQIEGRADRKQVKVYLLDTGPDFFTTLGIPLIAGRTFTATEIANGRHVAVVNEAFVKQSLEGRNPLGAHFGEDSPKAPKYEIVGVAADAKYDNLRNAIKPTAYHPLVAEQAYFELRTARNPSSLIPAARKIVKEIDPNLPLFDVKTQIQVIDDSLVIERLVARLSAAFGLLALTLACIGLYGLLSYDVARRTREIGIRMAIGAKPHTVRRSILRETLAIVLIGLVIGIPAALVATRALSAMLYGVRANDPATLIGITSMLLIVSRVAGYLPAKRASQVDPMVALRYE